MDPIVPQPLPEGTVCYVVQTTLDMEADDTDLGQHGYSVSITSETYYDARRAVRVAVRLADLSIEREADIRDGKGRTVGTVRITSGNVPQGVIVDRVDHELHAALLSLPGGAR